MTDAPIDLVAIIEAGLRAKPPRGDEDAAHMSDTVCDRQTWFRRSGAEAMPHDFRTLVKFELGHQFERGIGDVLASALFATRRWCAPQRDVEIEWNGLIGHADFLVHPIDGNYPDPTRDPFLLEIKSTSFLRGKIPDEAAPWYVEQCALYAAALNVARFGILVGCRESGKIAPIFWFNLDDQRNDEAITWREWANLRAQELALTSPDRPMPPAAPRTGWACKTCRYAQCERNPAFVAPGLVEKLEESYARNH